MSKDEKSEQIDDDIQQCKADILRARDMRPAQQKNTDGTPISQDGTEETVCSANKAEIPKFDLAEDIMAEQRKITAIRRKAPDKKMEIQSQRRQIEPIDYSIEEQTSVKQDRIIEEIVARDIESLC